MKKTVQLGLALAAAGVIGAATSPAVLAKIKCQGPDQIIPGRGLLSTPYCQDSYLAEVARDYGVKIRAEVIRENPNEKEQLCRFIGYDIRVKSICEQYIGRGGSRN